MMRSKIRSLFYVACGAVLVPACGDDSPATGETETEGDEDSTGGNDDDVTVTVTVNPDTSGGEDTTAATDPDTTTNAETTAAATTGGPCLLPEEIFEDPSFEDGSPNGFWGEASTNFGTPLCDSGSCGGDGASDGAWWAWFGGVAAVEVGGLAQTVQINELDELTLEFDFQIPASSGSADDEFYVTVDGTEIFRATGEDMATYASYTNVALDVSQYADGGEHEFEFISITISGQNTSFYVDNLRMGGCDAGMSVTMGDSVTGIDPSAGETEGETGTTVDPVDMCDEDIGNTVPFTQAGNNMGQGNDSHGSCTFDMGQPEGEDVTYSWTAPADGLYQFDTIGSAVEDTVLYVYDACMDGMEIACNDDEPGGNLLQSSLVLGMTSGQTVAVVVDGWSDQRVGDFVLNISQISCDPPNDLGNALPIAESGNNVGAGDEITPSCAPDVGGEDVIYSWTSPETALYTFDTAGSTFETVVAGYIGTCGDPAAQIGCDSNGALSEFTAAVNVDDVVTVVVDGAAAGEEGDFDFNITQVGPLEGDCCATDATSGCQDAVTTNCVCGLVPDCCTGEWDDFCVGVAATQCAAGCAAIPGGSCCDVQAGPNCDTPAIQDCVCEYDDFCCTDTWDDTCVAEAVGICNAECA